MPTRLDRHSRRTRSVLLWAAGIYVAFQLTASLLLDYGWPLLRFPSARTRMAELEAEPRKPEIVALGSSRFQAAIVPGEMSALIDSACRPAQPVGVFNAAVPVGDPISSEFMFNRLLEKGVKPRLVLFEVSPENLNRNNSWLIMHVRRQIFWHETPRYFLTVCRSGQLMRWLGSRLNPVYYSREEMWRRAAAEVQGLFSTDGTPRAPTAPRPSGATAANKPPDWDDLLRLPSRQLTSEEAELSRTGADILPRRMLENYDLRGVTVEALERVLARCQEQGIAVVLIGVPVTQPHRDTFTPEVMKAYRAYLEQVTQHYGCRFVDYRDRVPDNLFFDCHHLTQQGGLYFSRLLTHEVLIPHWNASREDGPREMRFGKALFSTSRDR